MARPEFRVEGLNPKRHDREKFTCGVATRDQYLKEHAVNDMRRRLIAVFVLVAVDAPNEIAGYFTLCAYAFELPAVPEAARTASPDIRWSA